MQGSLMRFYEYMDYPGIDILAENNQCYWAAKQVDSVARQLDKKWVLSELYGCTGWQMDFEAYKNIGDWQALFGVNLRCPHLSWYTMKGEGKRDYPRPASCTSPPGIPNTTTWRTIFPESTPPCTEQKRMPPCWSSALSKAYGQSLQRRF